MFCNRPVENAGKRMAKKWRTSSPPWKKRLLYIDHGRLKRTGQEKVWNSLPAAWIWHYISVVKVAQFT
jgi:hypothetical protein